MIESNPTVDHDVIPEEYDVVYVVTRKGMFLKNKEVRGRASQVWTNQLGLAKIFPSLKEARKSVLEMDLRNPDVAEINQFRDAWIRSVRLYPEFKRYELFSQHQSDDSFRETSEEEAIIVE